MPKLQINYTFYRNPGTALKGTASGASWAFPGSALTASAIPFQWGIMSGVNIVRAKWILAWNPFTAISPTGVRLVKMDDGPINICQLARIDGINMVTSVVDTVDLTDEFCSMLNEGVMKHIGQQTYGNGVWGGLIYASWIELIMEVK